MMILKVVARPLTYGFRRALYFFDMHHDMASVLKGNMIYRNAKTTD